MDSAAKLAEIEAAEKEKMKDKVEKIVGHGISCFINRQLIYNYPEQVRQQHSSAASSNVNAKYYAIVNSSFDHANLLVL